MIISGTGSIAFGRNGRNQAARAGGWGHVLGDEGSGYWIGRQALRAVVRAADGRGPATALTHRVLNHFALQQPADLIGEVYDRQLRHHALAQLARVVQQARDEGDEVATQILELAAHELVRAARSVVERLQMREETSPFMLAGGVFTGVPWLGHELERRLPGMAPRGRVTRLEVEPAMGAVRLALAEAAGGAAAARLRPVKEYLVRAAAGPTATLRRMARPRSGLSPCRSRSRSSGPRAASTVRARAPGCSTCPTGCCGIFRVEDRFVRCRHRRFQDPVYEDSCVEVFLQPKPERGYLNFEMSCGGAVLASYVTDHRRTPEGLAAFKRLRPTRAGGWRVRSTLPPLVEPEIESRVDWELSFFVPFAVIESLRGRGQPVAGREWRANLYKCGDRTSHPHWAAWSPVDALNFHLPHCFGVLRFESVSSS